jgi:hypothetical protein
MSHKIALISPAGISRIPEARLMARPKTLNGCTLGILENNKEFSDWVLDRVRDRLQAHVSLQGVVQLRKHHLAQPAAEELLKALVDQCHVVMVGVGH